LGRVIAAPDNLQFTLRGLLHGDLAAARVAPVGPQMFEGFVACVGGLDHIESPIPVLCICGLDTNGHKKPGHVCDKVPLPSFDLLPRIVSAGLPFSVLLTV